jgi:co-chaperonin GroES (HSP10)
MILVTVEKQEQKKGPLILPEKEDYRVGKVVASGGDVDLSITHSDRIFFRLHAGMTIKRHDIEYVCIHENDVYCCETDECEELDGEIPLSLDKDED